MAHHDGSEATDYYRHFDSHDDFRPGCKYCPCATFVSAAPERSDALGGAPREGA